MWHRVYCGSVCTSAESDWGFSIKDLERIMEDGDMLGIDRITHWMPAQFPSVP
jgi:hypothetical protein